MFSAQEIKKLEAQRMCQSTMIFIGPQNLPLKEKEISSYMVTFCLIAEGQKLTLLVSSFFPPPNII